MVIDACRREPPGSKSIIRLLLPDPCPFRSFRFRCRYVSCAPFVINRMSQNESSKIRFSAVLQVDHCRLIECSNRISSVVVKSLARLTNSFEIGLQPSNKRETKILRVFSCRDRSTEITRHISKTIRKRVFLIRQKYLPIRSRIQF